MNAQEMLDRVIEHVKSPDFKFSFREQTDEEGQKEAKCLYRGPDGTRCFIGLFIPDEYYDPEWDSNLLCTLYDVVENIPEIKGIGRRFLSDLQFVHDTHAEKKASIQDVLASLKELANNHQLEFNG